jgi:hypothetical protein
MDWTRYAVGGATRPDAFTGLNPEFRNALWAMVQAADTELGPGALRITSAYRSPEKQAELWEAAVRRYGSPEAARKWVAPPGRSQHNRGTAADFGGAAGGLLRDANSPEARWIAENAARFGLSVPMSWEPWQVELAGARGQTTASGGPAAYAAQDAMGGPQAGNSPAPPPDAMNAILALYAEAMKRGEVPPPQRDDRSNMMDPAAFMTSQALPAPPPVMTEPVNYLSRRFA